MAELFWTTIGAILTLSIYSFLYKDNPFYKFAEHLVVGVSAGYYLVIYYWNYISPNVVAPVFLLRVGDESIGFLSGAWWMAFVPGLLGLLLYMRFFPKVAWVGRWPLGIYVGGYAGLGISPVMQARVIRQLGANGLPLAGVDESAAMANMSNVALGVVIFAVMTYLFVVKRSIGAGNKILRVVAVVLAAVIAYAGYVVLSLLTSAGVVTMTNVLLVIGLLGTLSYFFFSMRHRGLLGGLARVGIVFLMVGFGASFGYTVMSRVSLLIGRVGFLLHDWLHLVD
ncbi:MAG: hypothetical protein GF400_07895 [Candidatus Eisenbacteria bacterium]|nr:hypothetical protein [Candidatus Eisenbacteria bacterium]